MAEKYRATAAAIRCVYGRKLRQEDYHALLNMHSVAEIAAYLQQQALYRDLLAELNPAYIHRGHLELLLNRNLFLQTMRLCKLERLGNAPFCRFFVYDAEVRELLKAIQLLPSAPQGYISAMDAWLEPYTGISLRAIAEATDAQSLIAAAAHTPYAPILQKHLQKDGTLPYAPLEIALRTAYIKRLLTEGVQLLGGKDRKALQKLIGEQIDLINLINAFRMKCIFHADDETLREHLLPVSGRLPRCICEELYGASDVDTFLDVLRATRYGRQITDLPEQPEAVRIEQAFQTLRYRTARNALHFSGHAAVSLYALHVIGQVEVRNLITIIEGIRYGKPVSYLQPLLITGE